MSNQSRTRFRPFKKDDPRRNHGSIGGKFGTGLSGQKQDPVQAALDEMMLRHAIETADALTDEEQAEAEVREKAKAEIDGI